jgi:hypothetical protein
MTDKEKAKEISKKYEDWWALEAPDVEKAVYDSVIDMAQWKDDRFHAILACIKYSLEKAGISCDEFINGITKQWEE